MRPRQLQLFQATSLEYGGSTRKGKRKIQRPFDRKMPVHLVFRSSRAKGEWSFLHRKHKGPVHALLLELAARYRVKLYTKEAINIRTFHAA